MASSKVFKATEGIISRVTDLTLFLVFLQFEIGFQSAKTIRQVDKAGDDAYKILEEVNYKSIRRALKELHRKGLIKTAKNAFMEVEITAAGRKRLSSVVPQYQLKRPWDKNIYLVTYDIPIDKNHTRDNLRRFLKRIGCGPLQDSLWVTPYNPTKLIKEFVEEKNIEGTILVSTLGKDGSIGEMTPEELVEYVYSLGSLNMRYRQFIEESKKSKQKTKLAISYLSILQDDPQLPFELLPEDWLGEEAYKQYVKIEKD